MFDFLQKLFDTEGFPPRWHCGTGWTAGHGWLHIVSDTAIFAAYAAIPLVLVFFLWRRRDLPYPGVLALFAVFIMSCGIGHLIEASLFWYPWYRFAGVVKLTTAVVSWLTVFALVPTIPKLLALPGLAAINAKLEAEIERRRGLEAQMQKEITRKEDLNVELQRFNRLAVDRELRMIDLKHEINELAVRHGEAPRYRVPVAEEGVKA